MDIKTACNTTLGNWDATGTSLVDLTERVLSSSML